MAASYFSVDGMNVLITGGTAGIGLATAKRLIRAGANVAIVGRRDAQELADEIGAVFFRCDVADEDQLKNIFEQAEQELGKLDFIFNNAGMDDSGKSIDEEDSEFFQRIIDINLKAVYNGIRYGARHMNNGGSIVNIASISAEKGHPGDSRYAATKAGVVALTRVAAIELAPRKIRVNAINPGGVWSEMFTPDHEQGSWLVNFPLLHRIADPEEIAAVAHFLASPDASYITGQAITVDGGIMAGYSFQNIEAAKSFEQSGTIASDIEAHKG